MNEDNDALKLAKIVLKNMEEKYNPIIFYGETGIGKTHLIQAIGNELKNNGLVIYVTAEEFARDFFEACLNNSIKEYRNKYMNLNVLLIDDIQFFQNMRGATDEFMNIFDFLYNSNIQMIFTSNKPISKLKNFSERMVSRLSCGLSINIPPYDLEGKYLILRNILKKEGISIKEDVIEDIVNNAKDDIRFLLSEILKIKSYNEISKEKGNVT